MQDCLLIRTLLMNICFRMSPGNRVSALESSLERVTV